MEAIHRRAQRRGACRRRAVSAPSRAARAARDRAPRRCRRRGLEASRTPRRGLPRPRSRPRRMREMTDRSALVAPLATEPSASSSRSSESARPSQAAARRTGARRHLPAPLLERQQASGEVPAVHGGDVPRKERLEVLRLVPVEEVPLVVREALDAVERASHAQRQLARPEVAEVVRRERRQEHHADVGRRRAVRRLLARLFLVVVDRAATGRSDPRTRRRSATSGGRGAGACAARRAAAAPRGTSRARLTQRAISGATSQSARSGAGHEESRRPRPRDERRDAPPRGPGTRAISRHRSARGDRAPSPNAVCAADVH